MTHVHDVSVNALDGLALRATLFEPPSVHASAIISSATAVPRGFYRAFAQELMRCGVAVLTYDYRGAGDPPNELRASKARMRDWGALDFPGAITWMRARYGARVPLYAIGHSVGGHVAMLAPNNGEIAAAVMVASQLGYWRNVAGAEGYRVLALTRTIVPLMTRLCGYFPGRAAKFGEDLAPGVLLEWCRWSRLPNYFFDDPTMEGNVQHARALRAPALLIGMSDDTWAPPRGIDEMAARLPNTQATRITIDPRSVGLNAIGHMGFFRSENGPSLWPHVTRFLHLEEPDEDERSA